MGRTATGRPRGGWRGGGRPKGSRTAKTIANLAALEQSRELTASAVIEQIRRGAMYDARKLFDGKGNYIPLHKLSAEDASMVAGFEFVTGNIDKGDGKLDRIVKVKLIDRARYVEMAAKYHGLLVERVKLEDDRPLRVKVQAARARIAAAREGK